MMYISILFLIFYFVSDEPSYHYDNKTYSAEKIDFRFISNATADPEVLIKWHGEFFSLNIL